MSRKRGKEFYLTEQIKQQMKLSSKKITFSFLIIAVFFFFISCSKKSVEVPKNILTKEELVPILVDIHLAQAFIGMNQFSDSSKFNLQDYSSYIYKSHHMTKEKYENSMAFYTLHPELLDEIYQEVINELSKKQSEAERK
jgi:hypothetical protein